MPTRRIRATIPGTYAEVSRVRQILPLAAADLAFTRSTLVRLEICLTEALTNVIRHGYRDREEGEIEIDFLAFPDRLVMEIADCGAPMPLSASASLRARDPGTERADDIPPLKEGGYGIPILRAVLDEIDYRRIGDRNVLTMTKLAVFSTTDPAVR